MTDYPSYNGYDDELIPEWTRSERAPVNLTDYTTQQAADYCGLTLRGFIYHLRLCHVAASYRIGRSNMYTRKTLDAFNATRRKAGRPRKTAHDAQGEKE